MRQIGCLLDRPQSPVKPSIRVFPQFCLPAPLENGHSSLCSIFASFVGELEELVQCHPAFPDGVVVQAELVEFLSLVQCLERLRQLRAAIQGCGRKLNYMHDYVTESGEDLLNPYGLRYRKYQLGRQPVQTPQRASDGSIFFGFMGRTEFLGAQLEVEAERQIPTVSKPFQLCHTHGVEREFKVKGLIERLVPRNRPNGVDFKWERVGDPVHVLGYPQLSE